MEDILNWAMNKAVADELVEAIKSDRIVPFVGAGMSCPVYPGWSALVDKVVDRLEMPEKEKSEIREMSDVHKKIERIGGNQNVKAALRDVLSGDRDIAYEYAKGLFNLIVRQEDVASRETTLLQLSALTASFPGDRDIACAYAKGLVNLTARQEDVASIETTLLQLSALTSSFPGDRDIAYAYAQGLFNLTARQEDVASRETTLLQLSTLTASFPGDHELVTLYGLAMNLRSRHVSWVVRLVRFIRGLMCRG